MVQIYIESIQYTKGHEPVMIQYRGKGATSGPFARTCICSTTQAALAALSGEPDYWGDEEIEQALVAHLVAAGVEAEIVPA